MAIYRTTEKGKVKISDRFVADLLMDAFGDSCCQGKIWPSTQKGKLIEPGGLFGMGDLHSHIKVSQAKDGEVTVALSVVVRFGASIQKTTDELGEAIRKRMRQVLGMSGVALQIHVRGIRSRSVARRDVEVEKTYGTD